MGYEPQSALVVACKGNVYLLDDDGSIAKMLSGTLVASAWNGMPGVGKFSSLSAKFKLVCAAAVRQNAAARINSVTNFDLSGETGRFAFIMAGSPQGSGLACEGRPQHARTNECLGNREV
ncbi:MAG: hypothetical protein ABSD59_00120 [Terracidiphilus sp.]